MLQIISILIEEFYGTVKLFPHIYGYLFTVTTTEI